MFSHEHDGRAGQPSRSPDALASASAPFRRVAIVGAALAVATLVLYLVSAFYVVAFWGTWAKQHHPPSSVGHALPDAERQRQYERAVNAVGPWPPALRERWLEFIREGDAAFAKDPVLGPPGEVFDATTFITDWHNAVDVAISRMTARLNEGAKPFEPVLWGPLASLYTTDDCPTPLDERQPIAFADAWDRALLADLEAQGFFLLLDRLPRRSIIRAPQPLRIVAMLPAAVAYSRVATRYTLARLAIATERRDAVAFIRAVNTALTLARANLGIPGGLYPLVRFAGQVVTCSAINRHLPNAHLSNDQLLALRALLSAEWSDAYDHPVILGKILETADNVDFRDGLLTQTAPLTLIAPLRPFGRLAMQLRAHDMQHTLDAAMHWHYTWRSYSNSDPGEKDLAEMILENDLEVLATFGGEAPLVIKMMSDAERKGVRASRLARRHLHRALLAVALERHRLALGSYPATLSDLDPALLTLDLEALSTSAPLNAASIRVDIDPVTGQRFLYIPPHDHSPRPGVYQLIDPPEPVAPDERPAPAESPVHGAKRSV